MRTTGPRRRGSPPDWRECRRRRTGRSDCGAGSRMRAATPERSHDAEPRRAGRRAGRWPAVPRRGQSASSRALPFPRSSPSSRPVAASVHRRRLPRPAVGSTDSGHPATEVAQGYSDADVGDDRLRTGRDVPEHHRHGHARRAARREDLFRCCCEARSSSGRTGGLTADQAALRLSNARLRVGWAVRAAPFYGPSRRRVIRGVRLSRARRLGLR